MLKAAFNEGIKQPSLLFINYVEVLSLPVLQILHSMVQQKHPSMIFVAAATDLPGLPSFLRSFEIFSHAMHMGAPNFEERLEIIKICCELKVDSETTFREVAEKTPNWLGSGLKMLCSRARKGNIHRAMQRECRKDLSSVLDIFVTL